MQNYLLQTEEVLNNGHFLFYLFTSRLQGTSSSTGCCRGTSEQIMSDSHRDCQIPPISLAAMPTTLINRHESNTARQLSEAHNHTD